VLEESPLRQIDANTVPAGKGWFVLNARDAPWRKRDGRGLLCEFEDPEGLEGFRRVRDQILEYLKTF